MSGPPALARALLRALLPSHEISGSLEGDLAEGFARRAAVSPVRARWWYRARVMTMPYLKLRREIGRLRQKEASGSVQTGGGWMGGMSMDLRVAVRSLLRRPSFTGVAIATLALSIGAATLVFSVVEGVLLTPLPYESPDELVTVYLTSDEWRESDNDLLRRSWDVYLPTPRHISAFREAPGPINGVTGYAYRFLPLDPGDGSDEDAAMIMIDAETFPILGVAPAFGRPPTAEELAESALVAVLRHETWTSRFGADPDVLGRSFRFGDDAYTVIGVMPAGFFFPSDDRGDLWAPVREEAREWPAYGLARMAPGTTVAEATDFFETVARRLGEDDPSQAGFGGRAVSHFESVVGNVKGGIQLLFGTALLVVLVACVNLGNLFLARVGGRHEELAVRASLGAGTGSLALSVLSEVLVVGLAGGGLGVLLAAASIDPFVDALGASLRGLPRQGSIGLDASVLLFSLGATLATALAAGLGPTLGSVRRAPASTLGSMRGSARSDGARRGQRLLLAVQGALTVVLVSGAALLARSFLQATRVDMGMMTDRVAVLEIEADRKRFAELGEVGEAMPALRARVAALPGVSAAGATSTLPSKGGVLLLHARPEGTDADRISSVTSLRVSPGYFASLGIPILAGRGLEDRDATATVPGAVVSESLAVQLFGHTDVLGRHVLIGGGDEPTTWEVVGVVGDARQLSTFQEPAPTFYSPLRHRPESSFYLTMSVDGDPSTVLDRARLAAIAVDPGFRVAEATTLAQMLRDGRRHIRLRMILMASLAALAGILAMIGISGVVAHFLSEQTREVGIRMALGARAGREVGRVVRHALVPTALGLAVGVAIARVASRVMESFVFGIDPGDPVTYVAVMLMMLATAGMAAWLPARRTAAVDPARVLKGE